VRQVISTKSSSRVVMLGADKALWREEISTVLPMDKFPTKFGGDGPDTSVNELGLAGSKTN
jgi:hypothetical protein